MNGEAPLSPEQIKNWRNAMIGLLGPYALIISDEDVQKMRDNIQARFNKPEHENKKEPPRNG